MGGAGTSHLLIDELKGSRVTAAVQSPINDHTQSVCLHTSTETGSDSCGRCHGGAGIDLNQPGPEVFPKHKVGPIELKAGLPALHSVLGGLQGVDHSSLHARYNDTRPGIWGAHLLQVSLKPLTGPHVVGGQHRVPVAGGLQVSLDGIVTQVDRAGVEQRDRLSPGAQPWGCRPNPVVSHPGELNCLTRLCWKIHRTEGQKLPPDPSPHSPKARASHFSEHSGVADRPRWQVLWFTLPVCGREGDGEDDPRWSNPSFTSD